MLFHNTEARSANDYRLAVMARIEPLSDAYGLIEGEGQRRIFPATLLERTLMPHADLVKMIGSCLQGPTLSSSRIWLCRVTSFFHELATNACKHGALSCASGSVEGLCDSVANPNSGLLPSSGASAVGRE